jgi:polyisoprenyl-phosphate glycosyltransferase
MPSLSDQQPGRLISIIVPVWNEEHAVDGLLQCLDQLRSKADFDLELLIVDDGSTDNTSEKLRAGLPRFPSWKLVHLSRNFGQQAAFRAGLDFATGDAIVFLDADLQDPPELIQEMVAVWRNGAQVVVARRRSRAEKGIRGFLLRKFHSLFAFLTGGLMPKDSGTFGLMDRLVSEQLKRLPEVNLFLPALRCWVGFNRQEIWYDRGARAGAPRQTYGKLLTYAWDGVTSFSELPLKFIAGLGFIISCAGFGYAGVLVFIKIAQVFGFFPNLVVMGFTTVAVAVLFMGGIQLFCLGIIGEYIARVYREGKRRPIYIVATVEQSAGT